MSGKFFAAFIVISALLFGAVMYYQQVYAFYEPVAVNGRDDVVLTSLVSQQPEPILYEAFDAIDASSSPIRYRACFTTSMSHALLSETYVAYDHAEPLVAPNWFDCFDAKEVGKALEDGDALGFLGTENIEYGIDRVIAVMSDGRGFAWHQINSCGAVVFDGGTAPAHCPPKPEGH